MSLREWLVAIGALVILVIVIDGIRRMRRARKDAATISSGMGADDLEESPLEEGGFNPELPNGGARPVDRDTLEDRGYLRTEGRTRFANPPQKPTRPVYSQPSETPESSQRQEPAWDDDSGAASDHDDWDEAPIQWQESDTDPEHGITADANVDLDADDDDSLGEPRIVRNEQTPEPSPEDAAREPDQAPPLVTDVEEDTARRSAVAAEPAHQTGQPLAGANRPEAQEVVVINVLAPSGERFQGESLKRLFEACGLEFGDMDIYHRHETSDTTSPVQFSVASAVEPGTFRPEEMPQLATPGISFFMSMPGPSNFLQAFEFMLETAQSVVRNLGGELKDERRSVMTPQTIEHCRQRIREYERKRRFQKV